MSHLLVEPLSKDNDSILELVKAVRCFSLFLLLSVITEPLLLSFVS